MTCPICNRPLCRTALGDSTDYEQRAKCYRLGYERERDAANNLAHLVAEQAVIIREVRDRGDAELANAVLRANGRESARREKAEAENARLRDELAALARAPICDYVTETGAYRCTLLQGHTEWHKVEPNHSPRPVEVSMPECPGPDCRACNGEACDLCGAGKTGFHGRCEHDVLQRHQEPPHA